MFRVWTNIFNYLIKYSCMDEYFLYLHKIFVYGRKNVSIMEIQFLG
jgi:hypothetical protein